MTKKMHPVTGHLLTIRIVIDCKGICNIESETEEKDKPHQTDDGTQVYMLHRSNGKVVTFKSERLLKAFQWLQGRDQTSITKKELAEALGLNGDQIQKVLSCLSHEKKVIHYEHENGFYNIIRVDDIDRLEPKYTG